MLRNHSGVLVDYGEDNCGRMDWALLQCSLCGEYVNKSGSCHVELVRGSAYWGERELVSVEWRADLNGLLVDGARFEAGILTELPVMAE